jgi:hypothetical protein
VPDRPELHEVKGLRVRAGEPKGGRLFRRFSFSTEAVSVTRP